MKLQKGTSEDPNFEDQKNLPGVGDSVVLMADSADRKIFLSANYMLDGTK